MSSGFKVFFYVLFFDLKFDVFDFCLFNAYCH